MLVVAVLGSPHGERGTTASLLSPLLDRVQELGGKVELFSLDKLEILPCRACDTCHSTGKCPIEDGARQIAEALKKAQGIVFASPNYFSSVTAQLKALIDRLSAFAHTQALEGKYAAAVVTGGAESKPVERYLLEVLSRYGCWKVGSVGASSQDFASESKRTEAFRKAALLGSELLKAIKNKKSFPDQLEELRTFADHMRSLVLSRGEQWRFEYEYWREKRKG